jgi:hypothetical protein
LMQLQVETLTLPSTRLLSHGHQHGRPQFYNRFLFAKVVSETRQTVWASLFAPEASPLHPFGN